MIDKTLWKLAHDGITYAIEECPTLSGESPDRAVDLLTESAQTIAELLPNKPQLLGQVLGEFLASAAASASPDAVRILKKAGANIDWRKQGKTPLHTAVLEGKFDMIRTLVAEGADMEAPYSGDTAVHLAVRRTLTTSLGVLLAEGADIEALTETTLQTPLHLAASREPNRFGKPEERVKGAADMLELVTILLDAGAFPFTRDKDGYLAAHRAIQFGGNEQVSINLLRVPDNDLYAQEDLDVMLAMAIQRNQHATIEALIDVGANIFYEHNGKNLLDLSAQTATEETKQMVRSLMTATTLERALAVEANALPTATATRTSLSPL